VQLKHDATETTWESHGWVKVLDVEGNLIAEDEDVQHNKNYSSRQKRCEALAAKAKAVTGG